MIEYESHCHGGLLRELVDYSYQIGFFSWEIKMECGKFSLVKKNESVKIEKINIQEKLQEESTLRLLVSNFCFTASQHRGMSWTQNPRNIDVSDPTTLFKQGSCFPGTTLTSLCRSSKLKTPPSPWVPCSGAQSLSQQRVFYKVHAASLIFQFGPTVSGPTTGHQGKDLIVFFIIPSFQVYLHHHLFRDLH